MFDKKRKKAVIKLVILMLMLILVIRIFTLTLSKFESTSSSNANIDAAFYVLNDGYQNMNINLSSLFFPKDVPYVYTFSVSNTKDGKTTEVDMEYEIQIKTTTNLPLEYELYCNQSYDDKGAINVVKTDDIEQDENMVYFRKMTTDSTMLNYKEIQTNTYQLVVRFPSEYNTTNYQDLIESLEISVDSRQVTGK